MLVMHIDYDLLSVYVMPSLHVDKNRKEINAKWVICGIEKLKYLPIKKWNKNINNNICGVFQTKKITTTTVHQHETDINKFNKYNKTCKRFPIPINCSSCSRFQTYKLYKK